MKMSKIEGINMMKLLHFPMVEIIDPNLLDQNSYVLKQGLSVRTSPKTDLLHNTSLPALHDCTNLEELREFIQKYKSEYDTIVHKTVKPYRIGSISRYEAGEEKVIIELFENFEKREKGIIKNRVIVPIRGERVAISQIQIQQKDEQEFKWFGQVIKEIRYMPFRTFDAEFVVEEGKILFTDLTIQSRKDREYANELKRELQLKEEREEREK